MHVDVYNWRNILILLLEVLQQFGRNNGVGKQKLLCVKIHHTGEENWC